MDERQREVVGRVEAELQELRSQLLEQTQRRELFETQLEEAKAKKAYEKEQLKRLRDSRTERGLKVTQKLQAVTRGWLVRRRFMGLLVENMTEQIGVAALQPDLLRDQLKVLQHTVHALQYHDEDQVSAATRLQAWWRCVLHQRVLKIVRVVKFLRRVDTRMSAAAMKIQSWYRGMRAFLTFREKIHEKMDDTKRKHYEELQMGLRATILVQTGIRAYLARRRVRARRRALLAEGRTMDLDAAANDEEVEEELVDTWRPAPGGGGTVVQEPPRPDPELTKLEEELGLVPFYWGAVSEVAAHRIGGPSALHMRKYLDLGNPEPDFSRLPSQGLGEPRDIYPDGLSQGFLEKLDEDCWPGGRKPHAYVRQKHVVVRRRSSRRRAQPPPSHTSKRAVARDARREEQEAPVLEPLHPLLDAPATLPRARRDAAPRRSAPASDEEDDPWAGATTFGPTARSSPRSTTAMAVDRQWWKTAFGGASLTRLPREMVV